MNNFILINRTYSEITPESSMEGDFSDSGFIAEDEEVSFSELVNLIKEHYQPSQSPNDGNINVWYSTGFFTSDYGTGTEREECVHFSGNNTPNAAKYWRLAGKAATKKVKSFTY